jgi:hypothetical protein
MLLRSIVLSIDAYLCSANAMLVGWQQLIEQQKMYNTQFAER